jgi:hypothetical protein
MRAGRRQRDPNVVFLLLTTFGLGGSLGLGLILCYVIELILLWLNPIDVMSVTPPRYFVFAAFSRNADSWWTREVYYDLACWLTDHKKFFSYPVMAFWLLLFSRIVSRPGEFAHSRQSSFGQKRRLTRLVRGTKQRLRTNALLALPLVFLGSPAAMNPKGVFYPGVHSLFSGAFWNDSIYGNVYYLAYRVFNPLVVWIVLTHLIISVRCLKAHATRVDQRVSGFFVATLAFLLLAILAHIFAAWVSLEQLGIKFLAGNFLNYGFALGLFAVVLYLLFQYEDPEGRSRGEQILNILTGFWRAITNPGSAAQELKQVVREVPAFAVLPLLAILLPSIWVPAAGLFHGNSGSTREVLHDDALGTYVDKLYNYTRFECPAEIRGHTRAALVLDRALREEILLDKSGPQEPQYSIGDLELGDLLKSYPSKLSEAKEKIRKEYEKIRVARESRHTYKRRMSRQKDSTKQETQDVREAPHK